MSSLHLGGVGVAQQSAGVLADGLEHAVASRFASEVRCYERRADQLVEYVRRRWAPIDETDGGEGVSVTAAGKQAHCL